MKKQVVMSALIVALAGGTAQAQTADHSQLIRDLSQSLAIFKGDRGFWQMTGAVGYSKDITCKAVLAKLTAAKVPADTVFELGWDTPVLKEGKHPISAAAPLCDLIATELRVHGFREAVRLAADELHKMKNNEYWHQSSFRMCKESFDSLIAAGLSPSYVVLEDRLKPFSGPDVEWKGTIADLKKTWCDAGEAAANAEREKVEGPYKKVLKADKLKMVLTESGASVYAYIVPGVGSTDNPQKLASAKVWLSETQSINDNRQVCRGGAEIVTVTRYQFDAAHKLVKTTSKQYCGRPPKNAYR